MFSADADAASGQWSMCFEDVSLAECDCAPIESPSSHRVTGGTHAL